MRGGDDMNVDGAKEKVWEAAEACDFNFTGDTGGDAAVVDAAIIDIGIGRYGTVSAAPAATITRPPPLREGDKSTD